MRSTQSKTTKVMIMYDHILYATDLSKESLETEKKVSQLAKIHGANLSVIHVVSFGSTVWMGSGGYFILAELEEEQLEEGIKALKVCADRIETKIYSSHAVQGSPNKEIVKCAKKINADIIVIGSHGHFRASDMLGTTASSVLNNADCDVLIIQSRN